MSRITRWPLRALRRVDPTFAVLFERAGGFVVEAAEALETLFAADRIDEEAFALLDEIEHKADVTTHDVLSRLEHGHRPPLSARETRALIGEIDTIVDAAEAAGELAVLTGVGVATPVSREMTAVLVKASREVASLLPYVNGGSGFRPYVARIHEYEHQGDALWMAAYAALFTGDVAPLDIVRWRDIYEQLETAIDACESTARLIDRALRPTSPER